MDRLPDLLDSNARVLIRNNGTTVAARRALNFISGATFNDDPINEEVEITVSGGDNWTTVRKASNESVTSNTTVQDDDELSFTAANGSLYVWETQIIVAQAGGTPNFKFGWTGGGKGVFTYLEYSTGSGSMSSYAVGSVDRNMTLETTKVVLSAYGNVSGDGTTFKFQWAQLASDANAVTVYAGSYLRYRTIT